MISVAVAGLSLLGLGQQPQWTNPIKFSHEVPRAEAVIKTLKPGESRLNREGDTLTFYYRQKEQQPTLINMVGLQLKAVEGTDGWVCRATFPDVDQLMMSYLFMEGTSRRLSKPFEVFRGQSAPRLAMPVPHLKGRLTKHWLNSKNLKQLREIEVYFPPNARGDVPVVFFADGQGVSGAAAQVERLILDGEIQPVALVGVYNGGYRGGEGEYQPDKDFRAKEYLKAFDEETYGRHLGFFCDEVRTFVERNYSVRKDRAGRMVTGFSNGGAFAFTAGMDRSDVFGHVFAYSVAAFDDEQVRKAFSGQELPKFSFIAGELELFIRGTKRAHNLIQEFGGRSELRTYQAGHDPALWNFALGDDLRRTFPKRDWGQ